MASPPSRRTRTGFMNKNDCPQQGTCSLHCPHLCLKVIFPTSSSSPPPPSPSPDDKDQFSSTTSFSPLVIAIIGILATALLLLSYYTLISKYCHRDNNSSGAIEDDPAQGRGRRSRGRRMRRHNNVIHDQTDEFDTDLINSSLHEPWQWHVSLTRGLDESLINSITTYKYRKGEGLVGAGRENCSVCLCEFGEGDCLRLLPKCDHAFHLNCIDTWLTTHSTCPLCRANIFFFGTDNPPHQGDGNEDETQAAGDDDDDMGRVPLSVEQGAEPEGEERNVQRQQEVRRCVSMDHLCQTNGTGNVCGGGNDLRVNEEQEEEEESKDCGCSNSTSNGKLMDTLKRSFSSGRLFYLTRHGNNRVSQNATTSTSNV